MDVYCENCSEPWDHIHVLDVIPGIRSGDAKNDCLRTGVLDTVGQWWKFWFEYRDQFYEASYRIVLCPACEPYVGRRGCKACYGHGRVWVRRYTKAEDRRFRNYFWGYHPKVYFHPDQPFRMAEGFHHKWEGYCYQGWSRCPYCFETDEAYWAAMKEAGWKEPKQEK